MTITDRKKQPTDRVVQDGEVYRVPMILTDGTGALPSDAFAVRGIQLTDQERTDRETRQRDYDARLGDAWKNPPAVVPATTMATPPGTMSRAMHDLALMERWREAR